MSESPDLTRLRREYEDRTLRLSGSDRYAYTNPAYLFMLQVRERQILRLLRKHAHTQLDGTTILEVGCGHGGVLAQFHLWGVKDDQLHGVDLLFDRLVAAKSNLSNAVIVNANGEWLPYPRSSFDVVLQFTAFSSILDRGVKQRIAEEMLRIMKPNGLILWYDFWLNPTNSQTKGIKPAEIRELFPGCKYEFVKITLAPPIARRVVNVSWNFALFLESLKIFNSHYLALIQK